MPQTTTTSSTFTPAAAPAVAPALDPFYEARAARSPLPRADFIFFIHMHDAATILLTDWMKRLAVMEKTFHAFDLFVESVTLLQRLVSIEKTITLNPERITADAIADLKLLVSNLEILSGHQLPLPPAPAASSDTQGAPASVPASSPASPLTPPPSPTENNSVSPTAAPTALSTAAPASAPQPAPPAPASPATPAVPEPAHRAVRACPILRAPGAALLKVFVTLARLTGRPAFELFKPELPRVPAPPQALDATHTSSAPSPLPASPRAYPTLLEILTFFAGVFRLSPPTQSFSPG